MDSSNDIPWRYPNIMRWNPAHDSHMSLLDSSGIFQRGIQALDSIAGVHFLGAGSQCWIPAMFSRERALASSDGLQQWFLSLGSTAGSSGGVQRCCPAIRSSAREKKLHRKENRTSSLEPTDGPPLDQRWNSNGIQRWVYSCDVAGSCQNYIIALLCSH